MVDLIQFPSPWGHTVVSSRDDFTVSVIKEMFCVMTSSYAQEERKKNKLFIPYKLAHVNDLQDKLLKEDKICYGRVQTCQPQSGAIAWDWKWGNFWLNDNKYETGENRTTISIISHLIGPILVGHLPE
mgnify:CR=1 FL=1